MTDDPGYPRDEQEDRNADLLRRIGEALEEGSVAEARPAPGDSPFFDALLGMKDRAQASADRSADAASRRMWAGIEEATQAGRHEPADRDLREPAERSGRRASVRPIRLAWLSAAAVVLAAAVITLLMLRSPRPVLVASAGETSVEYTTDDGSVVMLRAHSDLYRLSAAGSGARFRLEGEAFFDVTTRREGAFAVEAGDAVVEVLGTRFNVGTWSGETSVYLEEGRVRFAHASSGKDVVLLPGQSSRTDGDDVLPPVATVPTEHTDWLAGALEFDQQPVRLVLRELEQQYDITINVPDTLATETLSGRLLLGSVEESLRDLAVTLGGRFVSSGPDAYRFESR